MKIEKIPAYRVGARAFPTLEEAQIAAITELFKDCYVKLDLAGDDPENPENAFTIKLHEAISGIILDHAEDLMEILSQEPQAEKKVRKPRKDKGSKRQPPQKSNESPEVSSSIEG